MDANNLYLKAINDWKSNNCVGTAIIPKHVNDKYLILFILQRIYTKNSKTNVLIITETYEERLELLSFLTHQEDKVNNEEFDHIIKYRYLKIYSNAIIKGALNSMCENIVIFYHLNEIYPKCIEYLNKASFKLVIINNLLSNSDMSSLISICPILNCFKENEINEIRSSLPVKETVIGIDIDKDSEEYKLLSYYNEYITTSITILGSFENIEYAKSGNERLNISSAQICNQIATNNGWNPNLDMSLAYNVEIDKYYNPANIKDRACNTYEIIRNRSKLLSDYKGKLDEIYEIIKNNMDSKILIISKRAEFAAKVTEFINSKFDKEICGNYHDFVEPIPIIDDNGNYVTYKSGAKAGQIRYMKADMQKTYNENRFNKGLINVLSTNNAPDKDIDINIDIIIITSSVCMSVKEYVYRLKNAKFNAKGLELYTLFVNGSLEEQKLKLEPISANHTILKKYEKEKEIEENYGSIVVN